MSASLYDVHPGVAMAQKWIAELKSKTRRSLEEWMPILAAFGLRRLRGAASFRSATPTTGARGRLPRTRHGLVVGDPTSVPPGTRYSTYQNPAYLKAAPFATLVEALINEADPTHPTAKPVPYVGVQFAAIPEFQAIGTQTGQAVAGALAGKMTIDQALQQAQNNAENVMRQAGYIK